MRQLSSYETIKLPRLVLINLSAVSCFKQFSTQNTFRKDYIHALSIFSLNEKHNFYIKTYNSPYSIRLHDRTEIIPIMGSMSRK